MIAVNGAGLRASAMAVPLLVDATPPTAVLVHNLAVDAPAEASPDEPSYSADADTVTALYVLALFVRCCCLPMASCFYCLVCTLRTHSMYFTDAESDVTSYMYRVCPLFVPARQCADGEGCTVSILAATACNDGSSCILDSNGTPTCKDGSVCQGEDLTVLPNCDDTNPCTEDTCAGVPQVVDGTGSVVAVGSYDLRHGGMYYVDAWATNGVGTRARAKSRGWTVDLTEPEIADPGQASVVATSDGVPTSFQNSLPTCGWPF